MAVLKYLAKDYLTEVSNCCVDSYPVRGINIMDSVIH